MSTNHESGQSADRQHAADHELVGGRDVDPGPRYAAAGRMAAYDATRYLAGGSPAAGGSYDDHQLEAELVTCRRCGQAWYMTVAYPYCQACRAWFERSAERNRARDRGATGWSIFWSGRRG
jgi:ribosomal protein L37E